MLTMSSTIESRGAQVNGSTTKHTYHAIKTTANKEAPIKNTAVTKNAVTKNAVTKNAVTKSAVTKNAITKNAITKSAARGTSLAECAPANSGSSANFAKSLKSVTSVVKPSA